MTGHPDAFNVIEMPQPLRQSLRHDHGEVRSGGALVLAQLRQPAIAPALGALGLPKDRATHLARGSHDTLHQVAAKLAFTDGLDQIERELLPQRCLELQLLHFALQLLRPLFQLALHFLELALRRGDRLLLLAHFQRQPLFRILLCLVADGGQLGLHLLLDGELHLALGVVELALLFG